VQDSHGSRGNEWSPLRAECAQGLTNGLDGQSASAPTLSRFLAYHSRMAEPLPACQTLAALGTAAFGGSRGMAESGTAPDDSLGQRQLWRVRQPQVGELQSLPAASHPLTFAENGNDHVK
jgi:hypothetical protein